MTGTRLVAVVLVPALLLVGCANEPSDDGPLEMGTGSNSICYEYNDSEAMSTGTYAYVTNRGDRELEVTDVSLVNAENLELIDAVLMPMQEGRVSLFGSDSSWPPTPALQDWNWPHREDAVGSRLEADEQLSPVIGFRVNARDGSFDAVRFDYVDSDGREYFARSSVEVLVQEDCSQGD